MTGRTLAALLCSALALGCSADQPAADEPRPAVVTTPPPEPANFQLELRPGAPRVADAAPNPARGGQYPIGRAGNPVPPGSRVAPVTPLPAPVEEGLPAPLTTADTAATTTTTTTTTATTATTAATTSPPEAPTTTSTAPAVGGSGADAAEEPTTTTTTSPLLASDGIDP